VILPQQVGEHLLNPGTFWKSHNHLEEGISYPGESRAQYDRSALGLSWSSVVATSRECVRIRSRSWVSSASGFAVAKVPGKGWALCLSPAGLVSPLAC